MLQYFSECVYGESADAMDTHGSGSDPRKHTAEAKHGRSSDLARLACGLLTAAVAAMAFWHGYLRWHPGLASCE